LRVINNVEQDAEDVKFGKQKRIDAVHFVRELDIEVHLASYYLQVITCKLLLTSYYLQCDYSYSYAFGITDPTAERFTRTFTLSAICTSTISCSTFTTEP
jgi:hypothetical protein